MLGYWWIYLLVIEQFATENCPVEIVDLPMNSMVIFHSYVSLPEGTVDGCEILHQLIGKHPMSNIYFPNRKLLQAGQDRH